MEFVLLPFDGVTEFTNQPGWIEYGPGVELPVVNQPMEISMAFLDPVAGPDEGMCAYLVSYINHDDPPGAVGNKTVCALIEWNVRPQNCPIEVVMPIIPTLPSLRLMIYFPEALNWGRVLVKTHYTDIISKEAYEYAMEGKSSLDKRLARVARQKTKLGELVTEGDAEEAEVISTLTLYTNLLSDEIALYEVLNPPA